MKKDFFGKKAIIVAIIASLCIPAIYTKQTPVLVAEAAVAAPTGISIEAENGSATISWDAVSGAKTYALFMKDAAGNVTLVHNRITGTSYSFSGLKDGARYGFVLKAYTSAGWSGYSSTIWVTSEVVSKAPENVTVVPGDGEVTVSWSPSYAAQTYALFLKDTAGNVTLIHNRVNGTSYTVKGMKNGVRMGFVVKAYVNRQWSSWSKVAWATPTEAKKVPENLKANVGNDKITLTWDGVQQAEKYAVYQKSRLGAVTLLNSNVKENSYDVIEFPVNEEIGFVVKAYVNGTWGDYSAATWVTVKSKDGSTVYTVAGPENTIFKIKVDKSGKVVEQKIYDAKGSLIYVNTVTSYSKDRMNYIVCRDGQGNYLGYSDSKNDSLLKKEVVTCVAGGDGDMLAAITATIVDNNMSCVFAQVKTGQKKEFYFDISTRDYLGYAVWEEKADGSEVRWGYDTKGVLTDYTRCVYTKKTLLPLSKITYNADNEKIYEHLYEYHESHYQKSYEYNIYDSNGTKIPQIKTTYDQKANPLVETKYYADGTKAKETVWVNYASGYSMTKTCCEYDSNGTEILKTVSNYSDYKDGGHNLISQIQYRYGKKQYELFYDYYENGKKKWCKRNDYNYNTDGSYSSGREEYYDERGYFIRIVKYGANERVESDRLYENYDNGIPKKETSRYLDEEGNLQIGRVYEYDENQRTISDTTYSQPGIIFHKIQYEYHGNGRIKSKKVYYYDENGNLENYYYTRFDESGNPID